jgi:hypothetical protein
MTRDTRPQNLQMRTINNHSNKHMKQLRPIFMLLILGSSILIPDRIHAKATPDTIPVSGTTDFIPDGKGGHPAWDKAAWHALQKIDTTATDYTTKFRILHSAEGIYVLMQGTDRLVTSPFDDDFEDLYLADVYEVFLHPDPAFPVYFEYEISAKEKELVLIIPNKDGKLMGWQPWKYEGNRKVVKKTSITHSADGMTGWIAEMFFPYRLLSPLLLQSPTKGTVWNANFCRLDYDSGGMIKWSWSPIRRHFHEYKVFQSIRFE